MAGNTGSFLAQYTWDRIGFIDDLCNLAKENLVFENYH